MCTVHRFQGISISWSMSASWPLAPSSSSASHPKGRCNFSRQDRESFFLPSPGETRSILSYDHSRISRREQDYTLLFSCFERDRDFRKSFLVVEREKMELTLYKNSRDQEFSLSSDQQYVADSKINTHDGFLLLFRILMLFFHNCKML